MSLRNYITQAELAEYADINILDVAEADDRINQAEELIDAYVGHQDKHIKGEYLGQAISGSTTTLIDTSSDSALNVVDNYLIGCVVEIVSGTNSGLKRRITANSRDTQTITTDAFPTAIDSTSIYRIFQLAKFPRNKDVHSIGNTYYKTIPEAVKRATLAQMEYMINKGEAFFIDAIDSESESIGDYSYNLKNNAQRVIAPKARQLLRGIYNIKGQSY